MSMMMYYSALAVICAVIVIGIWLVMNLSSRVKALSARSDEQQKLIVELRGELHNVQDALHELRTGSLGVGQKVRELVSQLQETQALQDELKGAEPESKLYRTATKLAQQGATVEEIMQECELPRAEAELLVQLHQ